MGHHINADDKFQSDKHPGLPPDRVRVSLENPRSERALRVLAQDYRAVDSGFSEDLLYRLNALHGPDPVAQIAEALALMNSMILCGEDHSDKSRTVLEDARSALTRLSG